MPAKSAPLPSFPSHVPGDLNDQVAPEPPPRARYSNDPSLVQLCLAGNAEAWHDLVDRYGRLIYSVPRHYGLSEQDASDIMQNVFMIVLRNLSKLRNQDRLSAWLIAIAQHETMHHLKQGRRESTREWDFSRLPQLSEDLQRIEHIEIVQQAFDRLEPNERSVLVALIQDPPPSYDELAERLKIPRGSIAYWRKRAIAHLRQNLRELGIIA